MWCTQFSTIPNGMNKLPTTFLRCVAVCRHPICCFYINKCIISIQWLTGIIKENISI